VAAAAAGTVTLMLTDPPTPPGWKASLAYVPAAQNRQTGNTQKLKIRRFCDGTRVRSSVSEAR
jgi:hypothetical protein